MPEELDVTYDRSVDAAYFQIAPDAGPGEAVRQEVFEMEGRGEFILDFDAEGSLLGIEVIGASQLLRRSSLDLARRLD
jgi:uncharacterized protein YuzE